MNSDEERALFEQYGWTYDAALLVWRAPDGEEISNQSLVIAADVMGKKAMEDRLMRAIIAHGKRQ